MGKKKATPKTAKKTAARQRNAAIDSADGVRVAEDHARYNSARIVLVGESNVGKSCVAMWLAEDRYPEDHEHGTTHCMRFWPMEVEKLHPAAKPPEGQRRDVVLWDFGGQDDYRRVHQMFLRDTTRALIDPTRGRAALGELQNECAFFGYVETSAKTGRNIKWLRRLIADALEWDHLAKISRPELFQRIRDDVERRRKRREVVVMLEAFKKAIKRSYTKREVEAPAELKTRRRKTARHKAVQCNVISG